MKRSRPALGTPIIFGKVSTGGCLKSLRIEVRLVRGRGGLPLPA